MLERIIYNRLYLYLTENNLLYNEQFGFQKGHSTDHANVQLADQIHKMLDKYIYTLGVFIDLSKACDTANHKIFHTMEQKIKAWIALLVIFLTGNNL